ncbi:hypothetical protein [Cardinium endosymbiont of Philonthus spinipes]|uniref:hypothetical protein n=1 Tax=Cardinium endosymbiont of Philonthus spinipes TaxID=3077941 RepID=UPI00313C7586
MSELYPTILKYIYILLDLEKRKNKVFEHQTLDQQNESQTQLKLPHAAYLDMHIKKVHEKLEDLHAPFVNLQLELSGLQFGELQLALDTLQPHLGELQFDLDKLKRELGGLQLELSKLQRQLNKANEAYSFKLLHWLWFKIIQPICSRR